MAELQIGHQAILAQYKKEIRTKNLVHLQEIKTLLNTIFGIDHNQIAEPTMFKPDDSRVPQTSYLETLRNRRNETHYTITIHFPEFEISNTQKRKHIIKDLYVRFYMNADLKIRQNNYCFVEGLRTTYTPEEYAATYAHSHLPGLATDFSRFCLGTGPINMVLLRLQAAFNSVDFKLLLYHFNVYVRHESLTGVPHRKIENIGTRVGGLGVINMTSEQIRKLMELNLPVFLTEYKLLTYSVDEYKVDITITDQFSVKLAESIRANFNIPGYRDIFSSGITIDAITPFKMSDGRYSVASSTAPSNISPRNLIEFKGVQKQLYVGNGNTDPSTPIINAQYTHPTIIKHLNREFSRLLTTSAIKVQNAGW